MWCLVTHGVDLLYKLTFFKQELSLKRYTAQIKYKSEFIICQLSIILSIFYNVVGWNILHFDKCLHGFTLAGSENLQYCCEHEHHFIDNVNWNYKELII